MATKRPKKPSPVPVQTVCAVCGLDWKAHGDDPTTDDCIRLLKAEVAKGPVTVPYYPYPYVIRETPAPYIESPYRPYKPPLWVKPEGITKEIGTPRTITRETKVL